MWEIYVSSRCIGDWVLIHLAWYICDYTKLIGRRTVQVFIGPISILNLLELLLLLLVALGRRGFEETIELMHVEPSFDIGKVDLRGFCS